MKRIIKPTLSLTLIVCLCAAVFSPGFRQIQRQSLCKYSFPTSAECSTHEDFRAAALADSSLNVIALDDGDFYCESENARIEHLSDGVGYVNDEIILMFSDGVALRDKLSVISSIHGRVTGFTFIINKYQLKLPQQYSLSELEAMCEKLNDNECVALAMPNMAFSTAEASIPDDPWADVDGYSLIKDWDETPPADENGDGVGSWLNMTTLRSEANWWLLATECASAWDYSKYFKPINVGIVDSGFDTEHEDLSGKFSFPTKYLERTNRPSSHGTHVAGIVAATANNQKGISGICQTAKLICADWMPDDGQLSWSTGERILTGFIKTVKSGAKVINFSLGSSGTFNPTLAFFWNIGMRFEAFYFSYVFAKLLSRGYDFIVVQSAGNGDEENKPCDSFFNGSFSSINESTIFRGISGVSKQDILDRIIIVGSAAPIFDGSNYYQSSFSNVGDGVDIVAPGSDIYSCDIESKNYYSFKSGTSMAAPVVTGITAMTWSVNPELTGAQIKNIICSPDNTKYNAIVYYHEELSEYVYPFINAKLSVEAAMRLSGIPIPENASGYNIGSPAVNATPEIIEMYRNEACE